MTRRDVRFGFTRSQKKDLDGKDDKDEQREDGEGDVKGVPEAVRLASDLCRDP